jgi:hypothetical protein
MLNYEATNILPKNKKPRAQQISASLYNKQYVYHNCWMADNFNLTVTQSVSHAFIKKMVVLQIFYGFGGTK